MSWASWSDFLAMGGYALYVWGAYGAVAVLIAAEVALLRARRRNVLEQLKLMARERRHRKSGAA